MEKMDKDGLDLKQINIERLRNIFPECVSDGYVDIDVLKKLLGDSILPYKEKYSFSWPGKNEAQNVALRKSTSTLIPLKEKSKKWDSTSNLYIEGDNLESLKTLLKTYHGTVKMIYIDPPYNTGHDFVYRDEFAVGENQYILDTNQAYKSNPETAGRYHTDWLNMMYPRLKMAAELLRNDGIIFISIDDVESANLRKICDEIFGAENFIVEMINVTGASQNGEGVKIQKNTESCFVYAKDFDSCFPNHVDKADESLRNLNDAPSPLITRPDMGYTIYFNPTTGDIIPEKDYDKEKISLNDEKLVYKDNEVLLKSGYVKVRPGIKDGKLHRWRWGYETFIERKDEIIIQETKSGYAAYFKQKGFNPAKNILNYTVGTTELKNLFGGKKYFDFPKNTKMIKYLLSIGTDSDSIIFDFFSGSSTTADAVMQLNAEDGGHRKFVMIQLPEVLDEADEAYIDGYRTICDVAEERIKLAGEKIVKEFKENHNTQSIFDEQSFGIDDLDFGFKVFRLDSTNVKTWDPTFKFDESSIFSLNNIYKEGRSNLDVAYEVMLKYGVFNMPLEEILCNGKTVYSIGSNYMIISLNDEITEADVAAIAKLQPKAVVFKESGFADDNAKMNADYTFKRLGIDNVKCI